MNNMKRYEYDTTLHDMQDGKAYVVFPWDVPQELGKDCMYVDVSFDFLSFNLLFICDFELITVDESSCYIIPVKETIREALNKGDGDTIHVVVIDKEMAKEQLEKAKMKWYSDMLKQTHLLIAGPTDSGKSVVINGIISALLSQNNPFNLILIDPKRVELVEYRNLPNTVKYASEPDDMVSALQWAMSYCDVVYKGMQTTGTKSYSGRHTYVIIDNYADLLFYNRSKILSLTQHLCQSSRAANIHVIVSAQSPLAKVIPSEIRVNFTSIVALKTRTAQESRSIIGHGGCEKLEWHKQVIYITPECETIIDIPIVEDDERQRLINHWMSKKEAKQQEENRKTSEEEKSDEIDNNEETKSENIITDNSKQRSFFHRLFGSSKRKS